MYEISRLIWPRIAPIESPTRAESVSSPTVPVTNNAQADILTHSIGNSGRILNPPPRSPYGVGRSPLIPRSRSVACRLRSCVQQNGGSSPGDRTWTLSSIALPARRRRSPGDQFPCTHGRAAFACNPRHQRHTSVARLTYLTCEGLKGSKRRAARSGWLGSCGMRYACERATRRAGCCTLRQCCSRAWLCVDS